MILHHVEDSALHLGSAAPVVVMLGSLGSTTDMWQPQVAALAQHARVLRLDHRGHGKSSVPEVSAPVQLGDLATDVLETLDYLRVDRFSVVGLSLGGMLAQYLAQQDVNRIERVVAICTSARLGPASAWLERAELVRAQGMEALADQVVQRWLSPDFAAMQPALQLRLRGMIAATDPEGYAQCCEAISSLDLRADLAKITAPLLAIAGDLDPATPPEMLRFIAENTPGARFELVKPAAHVANLQQPAAVNSLLMEHLGFAANRAGQVGRSDGGLTDAERFDQGMRVRREVLGDAHVDAAAPTAFTEPFQNLITRYAWGDIWSRPGLTRRDRSLVVLGILTALGQEHELAMHVRVAYESNGLTTDEIGEVILQTGLYAGVPTANRGFSVAQEVLKKLGN